MTSLALGRTRDTRVGTATVAFPLHYWALLAVALAVGFLVGYLAGYFNKPSGPAGTCSNVGNADFDVAGDEHSSTPNDANLNNRREPFLPPPQAAPPSPEPQVVPLYQ